jgi:hypothetical protein
MEISKVRNSLGLEKAMGASVIEKEQRTNVKEHDGVRVAQNSQGQLAAPGRGMTVDDVNVYLRRVSTNSMEEIESLIGDLQVLREKLLGDSNRIEQDIVEFVGLSNAVIKLTGIISDSVARMKAPGNINKAATSGAAAPAAALSSSSAT